MEDATGDGPAAGGAPVRWNVLAPIAFGLACLGLIIPLLSSLIGLVLGVVARRQIRRSPVRQLGGGFATGAIVVGAFMTLLWLAALAALSHPG